MDLLEQAIERKQDLASRYGSASDVRLLPPEPGRDRIPTLEPGVFRSPTPTLASRFARMGRWESATHGDWLSLSDMEGLWDEKPADQYLEAIKASQASSERGWPDDAASLFAKGRLSLFAASAIGYERIFLLWLDITTQPEFWVYDANGVARYANLEDYLTAYLSDDLSAFERGWEARPIAG